VRERYPDELRAYRSRKGLVKQALIVMMDGDRWGVRERLAQLDAACRKAEVQPRDAEEHVAIFVPTWRIETWFAYLEGENVDELNRGYPKLVRTGDCQKHVQALAKMCDAGDLRATAPPSLKTACGEFHSRLP